MALCKLKTRAVGQQTLAFCVENLPIWYNRTIQNGIVYLRSKVNVKLVKGNIILGLRRKPDAMRLLLGVKRFYGRGNALKGPLLPSAQFNIGSNGMTQFRQVRLGQDWSSSV